MSKTTPFFSVIITNKNAYKWLDKCLSSLNQQKFKNFEVIFVDNKSTDDSIEFVKRKFGWVKIVKNNKDLGYACANNLGAKIAKGIYLFLMNTDSYLKKDMFQKLSSILLNHPEYHLMQLDEKQYDKKCLPDRYLIFNMDLFGYPIGTNGKGPIFYADGAGLVITKKLFSRLRGFDEKFYMYLEDVDLSWRARLLGEKIYFIKNIHVYHYTGGTSISTHTTNRTYITTACRRYHAQKNNLRCLLKNYSFINVLWSFPVSVLLSSIEGFLYLIKGNLVGFIILHKAILWNIVYLVDTLKERKLTQRTRVISDDQILAITAKTISKFHTLQFHGIPSMKI